MIASSPDGLLSEGVQGWPDSIPLSDLKEYLECPVCFNVPRCPPIFQCEKGHMICDCGSCRLRVHNCPQCRAVYKGHRLVFAEKLLEMVPVPCKYNEEGCQVELVWSRLEKHEKECSFGVVGCLVAECYSRTERKFWMRRLAKKLTKFFRSSSNKDLSIPATSVAAQDEGGVQEGGLDSILLSELKEYFECPVCYTIPHPPIFQCEKGHMICGRCRPRVQNCTQCRAVYKGHRLVFAEKMLEMVPVPCKYNEEGCQVELVLSRLEHHEKECSFGVVECPNTELGYFASLNQILFFLLVGLAINALLWM